jgi:hypothetical protein
MMRRRHHAHDLADMTGPQARRAQIGESVAFAFDGFLRLSAICRSGFNSSGIAPCVAAQADGPTGDSNAPTKPASGSMQSPPNMRASSSPPRGRCSQRFLPAGHIYSIGRDHCPPRTVRGGFTSLFQRLSQDWGPRLCSRAPCRSRHRPRLPG